MYPGDWYWIPSRAIPGDPITEFPYFTFLYGDPHAHLFALPITALVLVWLAAFVLDGGLPSRGGGGRIGQMAAGALIIGSLIPTNTWDMPTYLLIAIGTILIVSFFDKNNVDSAISFGRRLISALPWVGLLIFLVMILFIPYLRSNSRESGIMLWTGTRTPLWSYLMHWGLMMLLILTWYISETVDWLRRTPVSLAALLLKGKKTLLIAALFLFAAVLIACATEGVWVAWIALPMMTWSLVLLLQAKNSAIERMLFFISGTAFFITLFVEFFSLRSDLGRMNMVFKLYLQAWLLFGVVGSIGGLGKIFRKHLLQRRDAAGVLWNTLLGLFVIIAASYPILASADKIRDRMSATAPHSLDGMAYMETAVYTQDGFTMDLEEDYAAIRWMQDNVSGSPVILEGNATEYKWGNRFTVYTGLPGVIGWNYHQRQQRGPISEQVWERVREVSHFYDTDDLEKVESLLARYQVTYVIVGQMERGMYDSAGIEKFEWLNGVLWDEVYRSGQTVIYQVKSAD